MYSTAPEWVSGQLYFAPDVVNLYPDVVQFNQRWWRCIQNTTAANELPTNPAFWTEIPIWNLPTGYGAGALVMYGGRIFECIVATPSMPLETNIPNPFIFTLSPASQNTINWRLWTRYDAVSAYRKGQIVSSPATPFAGSVDYIAVQNVPVSTPPPNPIFWAVTSPDCGELVNSGTNNVFNNLSTYEINDIGVTPQNNSYISCRIRTNNRESTNTYDDVASTICISNSNFNNNFLNPGLLIGTTTGANLALTTNV
jgi:hypothetical protein